MTADQIRSLQPELAAPLETFRPYLGLASNFGHLRAFVAGLLADLKRKSIEPIALAAGAAVRTLQEFLSSLDWDHEAASDHLQRLVMVGQHLLYSDNHPTNPFHCTLASDLFLPEAWSKDRQRCRKAHIPEEVIHRPKWRIALDQLQQAIANGVRFWFVTFDEDYGKVPAFWFELDAMGQQAIGEVPASFHVFAKRPAYRSPQKAHASKRVDNLCRFSPLFRAQSWRRVTVKDTTRGPLVWEIKMGRVHLTDTAEKPSRPTDRQYALIVARKVDTGEIKYFISNAAASVPLNDLLTAAFARGHIELWFERAKQEAGLGAFEVRTYRSLLRHWFCSRLAMYFLAAQTQRLRGEKSRDHAGASGRGNQRPGMDDLEAYMALAG